MSSVKDKVEAPKVAFYVAPKKFVPSLFQKIVWWRALRKRRILCEALRGGNYKQGFGGSASVPVLCPTTGEVVIEERFCGLQLGAELGLYRSWQRAGGAMALSYGMTFTVYSNNDRGNWNYSQIADYIESCPLRY